MQNTHDSQIAAMATAPKKYRFAKKRKILDAQKKQKVAKSYYSLHCATSNYFIPRQGFTHYGPAVVVTAIMAYCHDDLVPGDSPA
jgi:hypothetical protein